MTAPNRFETRTLRRACPCAACGGEPDVIGQVVRPHVSYTEKSFQLVGFDLVGGYAIQPAGRTDTAQGFIALLTSAV